MLKNKRLKRYRLSNSFFLVIAIVVFAMGIGYAAISTTLEIDGTSDIDSASWNVHFASVQVTTVSILLRAHVTLPKTEYQDVKIKKSFKNSFYF